MAVTGHLDHEIEAGAHELARPRVPFRGEQGPHFARESHRRRARPAKVATAIGLDDSATARHALAGTSGWSPSPTATTW